MNPSVRLGITTALLAVGGAAGVAAQNPSIFLGDGGIQFPDGTVQTTAGVSGAPVEDTGQTQCFDETGSSRGCNGTGEDGELLSDLLRLAAAEHQRASQPGGLGA